MCRYTGTCRHTDANAQVHADIQMQMHWYMQTYRRRCTGTCRHTDGDAPVHADLHDYIMYSDVMQHI